MNLIEKIVYNAVKSNPKVKFFIRNLYQSAFDLLPAKRSVIHKKHVIIENAFHGFHDVTPIRKDLIIYLRPLATLRMPTKSDSTELVVYDFRRNELVAVIETRAFNYHKGARQQWISDKEFIFNDFDGEYCSKLFNISTLKFQRIPYPIDAYCNVNNVFSTFSYERLQCGMPGYGYPHLRSSLGDIHSKDEGIFTFEQSGQIKWKVTIDEVLRSGKSTLDGNGFHFFTHSSFSRCGTYLSFLHRRVNDDVRQRETELVVVHLTTGTVHIPRTSGMVSHYEWMNNNNVLMYASVNGLDGHYIYDVDECCFDNFFPHILDSDGHQTVSPSNELVLVDTYPNRRRLQRLWLFDLKNNHHELVASIYHPKKFQSPNHEHHWCCDLHPRFHDNGYSFDLITHGERSICIVQK